MTRIVNDQIRHGYKVLTHDLRPPIRGGPPLFDGTLPATLPTVPLDTSAAECGGGYHYCATLAGALLVVGLWPNGRPSRAFPIVAAPDALERGEKRRASSLTLAREATTLEIAAAITTMSAPFAPYVERMVAEQLAWREALARARRDPAAVEAGLRVALGARGLEWRLQRFESAWAAWAARDAEAAWAARDAEAAGAARDAEAAGAARAAWAARAAGAAWAAGAAGAAGAAKDALTLTYAVLRGWVAHPPDLLTIGLRDAYAAGLAIAVPTAPQKLGWAMDRDSG